MATRVLTDLGPRRFRSAKSGFDQPVEGLFETDGITDFHQTTRLAKLFASFLGRDPGLGGHLLDFLIDFFGGRLDRFLIGDPLDRALAAQLALGLRPRDRLWLVEVPLALPSILAGIKTSAVISVGTATIAAFIGAGGFGERIASGLALNDSVMLLAGAENIREVIAFPMNQKAQDLMMGAPGTVTEKQLRELHIKVVVPEKKVE